LGHARCKVPDVDAGRAYTVKKTNWSGSQDTNERYGSGLGAGEQHYRCERSIGTVSHLAPGFMVVRRGD